MGRKEKPPLTREDHAAARAAQRAADIANIQSLRATPHAPPRPPDAGGRKPGGPYVHNAPADAARLDAVAKNPALADNRKELALAMYRAGDRPQSIAAATGYGASYIHSMAKAAGVERLARPARGRAPATPSPRPPKAGGPRILRKQACADPSVGRAQAQKAREWLAQVSQGRHPPRNHFEQALAMFLQGKPVSDIARATGYAERTIVSQARCYGLAGSVRPAPGLRRAEAEGWIGLGMESGLRPANPHRFHGSRAAKRPAPPAPAAPTPPM